jgi:hypothetical protein
VKLPERMRSTTAALRIALIAMAGAVGAALAHLVIDVAGDYLLARDAYDGMAHHSRAVLLVTVGTLALLSLARVFFDMLDRRCASATSLRRQVRTALGKPHRFAAETAAVAIVVLAAMECFDCVTLGVRIDDIADVFGGSLALGLTTAIACGSLMGLLVHRVLRLLAEYEPIIAEMVLAVLRAEFPRLSRGAIPRRTDAATPIERRLLLARRGRKRGPPLPTPA